MHGHWTTAYYNKALRPHDYEVINSFAVCYFTLFILMFILYGMFESNKTIAFMLIIPVYYITICLNLASSVIYQSRTFTTKELGLWIVVNFIFVGCGILYFILKYEIADFHYDTSKR